MSIHRDRWDRVRMPGDSRASLDLSKHWWELTHDERQIVARLFTEQGYEDGYEDGYKDGYDKGADL